MLAPSIPIRSPQCSPWAYLFVGRSSGGSSPSNNISKQKPIRIPGRCPVDNYHNRRWKRGGWLWNRRGHGSRFVEWIDLLDGLLDGGETKSLIALEALDILRSRGPLLSSCSRGRGKQYAIVFALLIFSECHFGKSHQRQFKLQKRRKNRMVL